MPFTLLTDEEGKELPTSLFADNPGAISFCLNLEFHANIAK
jgi:hypothetical protein